MHEFTKVCEALDRQKFDFRAFKWTKYDKINKKSIPKTLKEPVDIIVRGEVFIGKEDFEKLNELYQYFRQNLST